MQKKGIDIHILARATNIRDSTLTKYTTNKIKPDIESAKKIEKFLSIELVKEFKNEIYEDNSKVQDLGTRTLGDMFENISKKKKK